MMAPVELKAVLLVALLNPAVLGVAFWMGSTANQWQKIPIAAFAGALAGSALVYLATRLGLAELPTIGRAAGGIFIAQFLFGFFWASIGYWYRLRRL